MNNLNDHWILLFFALILFESCATHTPPNLTTEERIEELMASYQLNDKPGCSIAIMKNDSIVFTKSYGQANLSDQTFNNSKTIFDIGSVSKSLTAACIITLVEKGKLSLDSQLLDYYPELDAVFGNITIQQLLNHTSGIRDHEAIGQLIEAPSIDPNTGSFIGTDDDIWLLLKQQKALSYEPGSEYLYINTGYWLLGQIVEKISKTDLNSFAQKHIFQALKMNNTQFGDKTSISNLSKGYHTFGPNETPREISLVSQTLGDGGVYSTALDIAIWGNEMINHHILGDHFWKLMLQSGVLNNGEKINYACGIQQEEKHGNLMYYHGGFVPGYYSYLQCIPDEHLVVAVLTNHTKLDAGSLTNSLSGIFIPTKELKVIEASPEELARYEGEYFSEQLGWLRKLQLIDGTLFYVKPNDQFPLQYLGDGEFTTGTGITKITFDEQTKLKTMRLINDGMMDRVMTEIVKDNTQTDVQKTKTLTNIDEYIGEFQSEEFDLRWKVYKEGEKLMLDIISHLPELRHVTEDRFNFEGNFLVNFHRDANNTINEFTLDFGRAKNIKFLKQ